MKTGQGLRVAAVAAACIMLAALFALGPIVPRTANMLGGEEPAPAEVIARTADATIDWTQRIPTRKTATWINRAVRTAAANAAGTTSTIEIDVVQTRNGPLRVVKGEILAMVRPGTPAALVDAIARKADTQVLEYVTELAAVRFGFDPDERDLLSVRSSIAGLPGVLHAGPNAITQASSAGSYTVDSQDRVWPDLMANSLVVSDVAETQQQAVAPPYQYLAWNVQNLQIPMVVEKSGASGANVVVALLDSGVAYENHTDVSGTYYKAPDLDHVQFVMPYDFVNGDAHANDDNGHGTQMATMMAGHGWVTGVAPNVKIMPVKVLDATKLGTELQLVKGMDHALDNGADVINLSLTFDMAYFPSPLMEAAVSTAEDLGVPIVAAAGNDGIAMTAYPAAFGWAIGVGGARPIPDGDPFAANAVRAEYSNGSAGLDVFGPGGTHDYDLDMNGQVDAVVSQGFAPTQPGSFSYFLMSGTSGAAAQLSGVVALLLEVGESPLDVRNRLNQTARRNTGETFNMWNAAGRADAAAAVLASQMGPLPPACQGRRIYANTMGVIVEAMPGERQGVFTVELMKDDLTPAAGAIVHGMLTGSAQMPVVGVANSQGVVTIMTPSLVPDPVMGVNFSLSLEAAMVDFAGCPSGSVIHRPVVFGRFDELSFRLMLNVGVGMSSSGLVVLVDPTAASGLNPIPNSTYHRTYVTRVWGTAMSAAARCSIFDAAAFANNGYFTQSSVVRTFGSGMSSSGLTVDDGFFEPTLRAAYTPTEVLSFGFFNGSGPAAGGLIVGGVPMSLDGYFDTYLGHNPGIVWMNHGTGMSSSGLVFDESMLSPALFESDLSVIDALTVDPDPVHVTNRGLPTNARTLTLDQTTVEHLGHDWTLLQPWATGQVSGSGLLLDVLGWDDLDPGLEAWVEGLGSSASTLVGSYNAQTHLFEASGDESSELEGLKLKDVLKLKVMGVKKNKKDASKGTSAVVTEL